MELRSKKEQQYLQQLDSEEEVMCYEDVDKEYRTGNFPVEVNNEFD